jgi:hypothetical protein
MQWAARSLIRRKPVAVSAAYPMHFHKMRIVMDGTRVPAVFDSRMSFVCPADMVEAVAEAASRK